MVTVKLLLLVVLCLSLCGCFFKAVAFKLSDDLWLDNPSPLTAADQEVVDIALSLHDLDVNEAKELDYETRSGMRREMNAQCKRLVKTIMVVNLLEPIEPESDDNIISFESFLNNR